jgi:hypothetical protein
MTKAILAWHKGWEPGYDGAGRYDPRLSVAARSVVPVRVERESSQYPKACDDAFVHGWDMSHPVDRAKW